MAIKPYWNAASKTSISLTAATIPILTIPIKVTKRVKSNKSPVTIAPAVAKPQTIAKNLLNLNSALSTLTSLFLRVPNSASTWLSVLLIAISAVNASAAANMNRLKGVKYSTMSPKGIIPRIGPPNIDISMKFYSFLNSSRPITPTKLALKVTLMNTPNADRNNANNQ